MHLVGITLGHIFCILKKFWKIRGTRLRTNGTRYMTKLLHLIFKARLANSVMAL